MANNVSGAVSWDELLKQSHIQFVADYKDGGCGESKRSSNSINNNNSGDAGYSFNPHHAKLDRAIFFPFDNNPFATQLCDLSRYGIIQHVYPGCDENRWFVKPSSGEHKPQFTGRERSHLHIILPSILAEKLVRLLGDHYYVLSRNAIDVVKLSLLYEPYLTIIQKRWTSHSLDASETIVTIPLATPVTAPSIPASAKPWWMTLNTSSSTTAITPLHKKTELTFLPNDKDEIDGYREEYTHMTPESNKRDKVSETSLTLQQQAPSLYDAPSSSTRHSDDLLPSDENNMNWLLRDYGAIISATDLQRLSSVFIYHSAFGNQSKTFITDIVNVISK